MHPVTQLFDLIEGPVRHALVRWAFEKGVFDCCEGPVSAQELAHRINSDAGKTKRALQALVACDFLVTEGDRFCVDPDFAPYALRSSPKCFAQTFLDLGKTRHAGLGDISRIIDGQSYGARQVTFDAAHWHRQQRSLAAFHKSVAAKEMLAAIRSVPEWQGARRVLDVGGGSLELGKAILTEKPDAQVTLFDLPQLVDGLAQEEDPRLDICAGDYNHSATLPAGPFDIIWCSMSLYFVKNLEDVIVSLRDRLKPGGVLVSFHEDLAADRCQPAQHVVGRMMPALLGKDVSFAGGVIAANLKASGLNDITSDMVETPFGTFRIDAGRKES